jgi:hypothetical protein
MISPQVLARIVLIISIIAWLNYVYRIINPVPITTYGCPVTNSLECLDKALVGSDKSQSLVVIQSNSELLYMSLNLICSLVANGTPRTSNILLK